jgi:hypothetical protein
MNRSSHKVHIILILIKLQFINTVPKSPQISSYVKILPAGVEWFHVDREGDGWTDSHDAAKNHFS